MLSVLKFHDEDEAVRIANDSDFGLGAYLHTRDIARAHRVADDLDAGWEGGRAGIEEYVHHKSVTIPID